MIHATHYEWTDLTSEELLAINHSLWKMKDYLAHKKHRYSKEFVKNVDSLIDRLKGIDF